MQPNVRVTEPREAPMRPGWRSGITFLFLLFCAADASAERRFVYTNDDVAGPNTVSGFKVDSNGTLVPVPGSPFSTGGTGNHGGFFATNRAAVFASRDLLFVSNGGSNDISVFRIDRLTGSLALVSGSPFSSGGVSGLGISLATTPDGRFLIAANAGSRNLVVFKVTPTGALQPILSRSGLPDAPDAIKVSPDGHLLAVAYPEASLIEMYVIGQNGELMPAHGSPFVTTHSAGVDINCTSDRLFAGAAVPGTFVEVFSIATGGALIPIAGSPFAFNSGSIGNVVLLNPTDQILFVSNQETATITTATVDQDGALALVPGSPFPVGATAFDPAGMATDRSGRFLYVADFVNEVAVFMVSSTGSLVAVPGSPFSTMQAGGLLSLAGFPPKSCAVPVKIEINGNSLGHLVDRTHGKIHLRVVGSPGFDPEDIDPASVTFEGAPVLKALRKQRKNADRSELVLWFDAAAVDVHDGAMSACIFGTLASGRPFTGCVPLETRHATSDRY
jgi:6-phosphogluconolactonase (cycloisomerase 2 family)